jgi:peptidoglycan-associated lipoprotein
MKRLSVRLTLVLCVALAVVVFLSGCPKQEVEPVAEPVTTEPGPTDRTPTEPPPTPEVDINALKAQIKDVFFDFDKFELRSDARAILQENARLLKEIGGNLVLEGHCDERGTEDYNLALGQRRADAVLEYLTDLGVSASGVRTVSYGEERPFDSGHDESAWAKNRVAHFEFE